MIHLLLVAVLVVCYLSSYGTSLSFVQLPTKYRTHQHQHQHQHQQQQQQQQQQKQHYVTITTSLWMQQSFRIPQTSFITSNPTTTTTKSVVSSFVRHTKHNRIIQQQQQQQQLRASSTNNDDTNIESQINLPDGAGDETTTNTDLITQNITDEELYFLQNNSQDSSTATETIEKTNTKEHRTVAIIGAGWAGLSAAYQLVKHNNETNDNINVIVIEASSRVGGLVRDGYTTVSGTRPAEAGQHGFWNNYYNIYNFLQNELSINTNFTIEAALTDYAEQGQYSPSGIQAIWPIYKDQPIQLPTGLAQAIYTKFFNLPLIDLISALPLVIAFSDFNDRDVNSWEYYDKISFYDLCKKLGVSKRCYDEAFEPMILTGLFAPGHECSAAAALGMAYFFVLLSQISFDVQWCRGNIGNVIFDPWIQQMQSYGNIQFMCNTRVTGFELFDTTSTCTNGGVGSSKISTIKYKQNGDSTESTIVVDDIIMAVGGKALNMIVKNSPELSQFAEYRKFTNLRGTSVVATRIFLDRTITIPYAANACWGFDDRVGMTMFDISTLHGPESSTTSNTSGSVIEVDYYYANTILCMTDDEIIKKVKNDLDTILGHCCRVSKVVDAAIVRLPDSVNWYYPGSYNDMPDVQTPRGGGISNLYFAGDIVHTKHGSWSQEKAYVTGIEAVNTVLGLPITNNIIPLPTEEVHVQFGRYIIDTFKTIIQERRTKKNVVQSIFDILP